MKKIVSVLMSLLIFLLPTIASAHTSLKSSSPSEGQNVKDELSEISLLFEGDIEELSRMKLLKDGEEIPFVQLQIIGQQMIGTLSQPLETGAYLIQWNIAGEDSHPIEGTVSFSVEESDNQNPPPASNTEPDQEEVKQENDEATNNAVEEHTNPSSSSIITLTMVALCLILAIGSFILFKRKR